METSEKTKGLNLKATELKLGLPGSESPERERDNCVPNQWFCFGAKRGFLDTNNGGSGRWVFSGSEPDLAKNGGLFSLRGVNGGGKNLGGSESDSVAVKEAVSPPPKPVPKKKPQDSGSAPSAK